MFRLRTYGISIVLMLSANLKAQPLNDRPLMLFDKDLSLLQEQVLIVNPSEMIFDEEQSRTIVAPFMMSESGLLQRRYDAGTAQTYRFESEVVTLLGTKGTFRGTASYDKIRRGNVYSAIRMDPYAGDAFMTGDTIVGGFDFSGPRMQFEYAYELFPDIAIGFLSSYRIADGLKDAYSHAHTLRRDLDFGVGFTAVWDRVNRVGAFVRSWSEQEKIDSEANDDLTEIEVYSYRGETYSVKRRGSPVTETYRSKGWTASVHGTLLITESVRLSCNMSAAGTGMRSLYPYGVLDEFEDGFGQTGDYTGILGVQFNITDDLMLEATGRTRRIDHWSRLSSRSLLLWEWNATEAEGTAKATWQIDPLTSVFGGGSAGSLSVDSSKFIDARFTKRSAPTWNVFAGLRTELASSAECSVRGFYGASDFDTAVAGDGLKRYGGTVSIQVPATASIRIGCFVNYRHITGEWNQQQRERNTTSAGIAVQLIQ